MANAKHSWTERKRQIPDLFFRRGLISTWFSLPSLIEVLSTHKTPLVVPRTRYLVLGSPYRPTEPWEYPGTTHPVPGWDPLVKQIHVFRTPVQDLLRNTAEQVLHHLLNQYQHNTTQPDGVRKTPYHGIHLISRHRVEGASTLISGMAFNNTG